MHKCSPANTGKDKPKPDPLYVILTAQRSLTGVMSHRLFQLCLQSLDNQSVLSSNKCINEVRLVLITALCVRCCICARGDCSPLRILFCALQINERRLDATSLMPKPRACWWRSSHTDTMLLLLRNQEITYVHVPSLTKACSSGADHDQAMKCETLMYETYCLQQGLSALRCQSALIKRTW